MAIPYFGQRRWQDLTRDERFFCSILYSHAIKNPADFAKWVIQTSGLSVSPDGDWDIGFEVCFYRDMLWHMGDSAPDKGLPPKRTFDLCLFGERDIVIIEAKVYEPFDSDQNVEFSKDYDFLKKVPGLEEVNPHVIALASSIYFENAKTYGRDGTLDVFKGKHIHWNQAFEKYGDPLLEQANKLYKTKERKLMSVSTGNQSV